MIYAPVPISEEVIIGMPRVPLIIDQHYLSVYKRQEAMIYQPNDTLILATYLSFPNLPPLPTIYSFLTMGSGSIVQ